MGAANLAAGGGGGDSSYSGAVPIRLAVTRAGSGHNGGDHGAVSP